MITKITNNKIYVSLDSNYKDYQECITLYLLIDSDNNITESYINLHTGIDECLFENVKDGWYKIYSIVIPKYEYVLKGINTIYKYDKLFCYKDGYVYEYLFRKDLLKDIDYTSLINDRDVNITTTFTDIFIDDTLNKALILYIKTSNGMINLESTFLPKCSDNRVLSEKSSTTIRNYLNMIFEMIKYNVKCYKFSSAQKLLNLVKKYCDVKEIDCK